MDIESAPPQRVRVFDAFRHRDFRLLWSGQFVSLIRGRRLLHGARLAGVHAGRLVAARHRVQAVRGRQGALLDDQRDDSADRGKEEAVAEAVQQREDDQQREGQTSGALISAGMIAVTMTRPWLRAVE